MACSLPNGHRRAALGKDFGRGRRSAWTARATWSSPGLIDLRRRSGRTRAWSRPGDHRIGDPGRGAPADSPPCAPGRPRGRHRRPGGALRAGASPAARATCRVVPDGRRSRGRPPAHELIETGLLQGRAGAVALADSAGRSERRRAASGRWSMHAHVRHLPVVVTLRGRGPSRDRRHARRSRPPPCAGFRASRPPPRKSPSARDLLLAEITGARLHIAPVTTAGSVDLIRAAKARGVAVDRRT